MVDVLVLLSILLSTPSLEDCSWSLGIQKVNVTLCAQLQGTASHPILREQI